MGEGVYLVHTPLEEAMRAAHGENGNTDAAEKRGPRPTATDTKPRLLDQLREALRARHYSRRPLRGRNLLLLMGHALLSFP